MFTMKIKVEPKTCAAVQCLENKCRWNRACANHIIAGDFRTEGGSRPVLTLRNGEIHCRTFHSKAVNEGYPELPWDTPADVDERPWYLQVQGCCDYNCVLWGELIEETDTYEI